MDSSPSKEARPRLPHGRPCHITLPFAFSPDVQPSHNHLRSFEDIENLDTTEAPPPPPPVPPRRHTLAEICRYADEQCAYIEWMTREFEAEEASRRHSVPSTPPGAITNPFNGRADMWWRPASAEDMYGTSALRRKHEGGSKTHPYLAHKEPPELLESSTSRSTGKTLQAETLQYASGEINEAANQSNPLEIYAEHVVDYEALLDQPSSEIFDFFQTSSPLRDVHDFWSERPALVTRNQSFDYTPDHGPQSMVGSNTLLMVPKFLLDLLLSPLTLVLGLISEEPCQDADEC